MRREAFRILKSAQPGVQAVEADTSFSFGRHTHDQFGVGLMLRGAQKSASGRGTVESGAGDIITVNPGEVHDGAPIGEGGRFWRMLYFDPSIVWSAAEEISDGRNSQCEFAAPVVSDARIAPRFAALFASATAESDRDSAMAYDERLLSLLSRFLKSPRVDDPTIPSSVARARRRIDDAPEAPLTLASLAKEAGLSRFQLLRSFSRATGLTPHAYLMQKRMHLARRLIASGEALAEAASASGFADQSHMTRQFVRCYGLTPGAYAAALR